jgi:hypothetical protein
MKTIKIFLSITGFALSTLCFGQQVSQNDSEPLFYTAHYNVASNQMVHQITELPERPRSGDHFETKVLRRTYFAPIKFDMPVEEWMTKPFESNYYEDEIQLESWMLLPFESNYHEEELKVETWMTSPWD